MTNMNYWNQFGLLRAFTWENDQNGLLRVAYYHLLGGKPKEHLENALTAMGYMHDGKGRWAQHPETTWDEDRASHDEATAIMYFLTLGEHCENMIKDFKLGYYAKYIQIIFFLLAIKYKSKIALWIACWIIYFGVAKKEKAKNGRWDTDSELLALLKIDTIEKVFGECPLKDSILARIIQNWGDNYEKVLIDEMLHYAPDHPLRNI